MTDCIDAFRNKISSYLKCLQIQLCFVNDCLIGIDSIIKANQKPKKDSVTKGFVKTALLAMQDDVIITLAKIFDNSTRNESISIDNLITVFNKNESCFPEEWQKDKYKQYCEKYYIDDILISGDNRYAFCSVADSLTAYEKVRKEFDSSIKNIKVLRNKYCAHNDRKYAMKASFRELEEKYPFNLADIKKIVEETFSFLRRFAMVTGNELIGEHSFFADNFAELIE